MTCGSGYCGFENSLHAMACCATYSLAANGTYALSGCPFYTACYGSTQLSQCGTACQSNSYALKWSVPVPHLCLSDCLTCDRPSANSASPYCYEYSFTDVNYSGFICWTAAGLEIGARTPVTAAASTSWSSSLSTAVSSNTTTSPTVPLLEVEPTTDPASDPASDPANVPANDPANDPASNASMSLPAATAPQPGPPASSPDPSPSVLASSQPSSNAGPIAGGVVGGVAALALLGGLVFFVLRTRRKQVDDNYTRPAMMQQDGGTLLSNQPPSQLSANASVLSPVSDMSSQHNSHNTLLANAQELSGQLPLLARLPTPELSADVLGWAGQGNSSAIKTKTAAADPDIGLYGVGPGYYGTHGVAELDGTERPRSELLG